MADETQSNGSAQGAQLSLQKVYLKDASFEVPGAPQIFQETGQPQIQLNLQQQVGVLAENVYEVVLTVTVTCKLAEKTAYLAEVQQAGVFGVAGFDQQNRDAVLATYCPNVLFPYARVAVSQLVTQGGFPNFVLPPVDFDQLFARGLAQQQAAAAAQGPAN